MKTNNNTVSISIDKKAFVEIQVSKYHLNAIFECADESLRGGIYNKIVTSGLKMPREFYDGAYEAYSDIWYDVIIYDFGERDDDEGISLDKIIERFLFDKPEKPSTLEEIRIMSQDLNLKRKYHEYLHWFKWSAIECEEVKSRFHFCNPVNSSAAREWAEELITEFGLDYFHISDFYEFGYLYGQFHWLNWLRFYLENPEEFADE